MRADYLPFGGCYTTEGYAGSAIWAPAGKPLQTGLPGDPHHGARAAVRGRPTSSRRCACSAPSRRKHPHEPHWYLASLGTAVDQQGKGVGSALMRPVLGALRPGGLPCYLESSKERNVPFYRRHGFEVVEEVPLGEDGPSIWTMWREPQPAVLTRSGAPYVGWMPSGMDRASLTTSPSTSMTARAGAEGRPRRRWATPTRRRGRPVTGSTEKRPRRWPGTAVAGRMAGP